MEKDYEILRKEGLHKKMDLAQIINMASMAGMAPGFGREMIGYSVSKHGVVALTRTMANDPRWVPKTPHVIVKITFGRRELAIFHCFPQSS